MLAQMRCALASLTMLVALLGAVAGAHAQVEPAVLTDAAVVDREGALEIWVRLTRPARYQAELMDGPFRLVVDFEDTAYRWSAKPVPVGIDPVRVLRGSQFRKGVARLVIELHRQVTYTIEQDREGLRIVLPMTWGPRDGPQPPQGSGLPGGAVAPLETR